MSYAEASYFNKRDSPAFYAEFRIWQTGQTAVTSIEIIGYDPNRLSVPRLATERPGGILRCTGAGSSWRRRWPPPAGPTVLLSQRCCRSPSRRSPNLEIDR